MSGERSALPVILGGIVLAGAVLLGVYAAAQAAPATTPPPPTVYTCPVDGQEFATLEELQYHFTTEHPRTLLPIEWE
ncbi:hypothetical protein LCGC14_1643590 [marine sediment metagenome]|uniref:Uncharacterized protein n=1 Tax=marine sediment metagenome TaxID=412755 RepID=A0A0F9KYR5_9ZZZZ